jgi:toxin-antitoxin system PIN domain toxin
MILLDANLLLYAKFSDVPQHLAARRWVEGALNGSDPVGIPWPSYLAFLRISTNPKVFDLPLTAKTAWQQVQEWVDHPRTWIPQPTAAHTEVLGELILEAEVTVNEIPDAHLAALAIEHGLTLCSSDGDFKVFPGLDWHNPLGGEDPSPA